MKTVKAVVQVIGHSKVPMVPKYSDDLRAWYQKVHSNCIEAVFVQF